MPVDCIVVVMARVAIGRFILVLMSFERATNALGKRLYAGGLLQRNHPRVFRERFGEFDCERFDARRNSKNQIGVG